MVNTNASMEDTYKAEAECLRSNLKNVLRILLRECPKYERFIEANFSKIYEDIKNEQ